MLYLHLVQQDVPVLGQLDLSGAADEHLERPARTEVRLQDVLQAGRRGDVHGECGLLRDDLGVGGELLEARRHCILRDTTLLCSFWMRRGYGCPEFLLLQHETMITLVALLALVERVWSASASFGREGRGEIRSVFARKLPFLIKNNMRQCCSYRHDVGTSNMYKCLLTPPRLAAVRVLLP